MRKEGASPQEAIARAFLEKTLKKLAKDEKVEQLKRMLKTAVFPVGKQPLLHIFSQDLRNTDNAWIETKVFHYHDESGSDVGQLKFAPNQERNSMRVEWRMAHCCQRLFASHSAILKYIVDGMDAYWGEPNPAAGDEIVSPVRSVASMGPSPLPSTAKGSSPTRRYSTSGDGPIPFSLPTLPETDSDNIISEKREIYK